MGWTKKSEWFLSFVSFIRVTGGEFARAVWDSGNTWLGLVCLQLPFLVHFTGGQKCLRVHTKWKQNCNLFSSIKSYLYRKMFSNIKIISANYKVSILKHKEKVNITHLPPQRYLRVWHVSFQWLYFYIKWNNTVNKPYSLLFHLIIYAVDIFHLHLYWFTLFFWKST